MKTKTRIKKPIIDPAAIDIETVLCALAVSKNDERKLVTRMDAELQAVRDRYCDPILAVQDRVDTYTTLAQEWAEANPDRFAKKKSIELTHGTIGFRTGTPKLKLLAKWSVAGVLFAMRKFQWAREYIRIKESIDRKNLIADKIDPETLARIGLRVTRSETFFVEPNLTELQTRETAPVLHSSKSDGGSVPATKAA
jgi:phage host-nuclease inhibitor protein Gam